MSKLSTNEISLQPFILFPALSAAIFVWAIFFFIPWLAFIALVPLFYSLKQANGKQTLISSGVFGITYTLFLFFWMIKSSVLFTGDVFYGNIGMLLSVSMFTVAYILLFYLTYTLSKKWPTRKVFIMACVLTLFEFGCDSIFKTLPFFNPHFGNPLLGSLYSMQLAEVGGIYILSFIVIVINGYLVDCLNNPAKIKILLYLIAAFVFSNVSLHFFRTTDIDSSKEIKINLLTPNVMPDNNWEQNGNEVVESLLTLNKNAAAISSDLNIWTESFVPWTYSSTDDFVKAILNEQTHAVIVLGMNTDCKGKIVYNSAYVINADQKVIERYDKVNPLTFMETPLTDALPMFHSWGYQVKPGIKYTTSETPKGRAGILICNEASIASAAGELSKNGAQFLINIGNDGWFKDTYLAKQHFYLDRLRAVETRRDVAINNNCGFTGKASADGSIELSKQNATPTLMQISLIPRSDRTFYTEYPIAIILLITLLLITLIFFK